MNLPRSGLESHIPYFITYFKSVILENNLSPGKLWKVTESTVISFTNAHSGFFIWVNAVDILTWLLQFTLIEDNASFANNT